MFCLSFKWSCECKYTVLISKKAFAALEYTGSEYADFKEWYPRKMLRDMYALYPFTISIGDYVLTGGELPALILVDAIARLIPGVLNQNESFEDESFENDLLEYPHYTRPREFMGLNVPDVFLSGNHQKIEAWRKPIGKKTIK